MVLSNDWEYEKEKRRKGAEVKAQVLLFPSSPFPLCSKLAVEAKPHDGDIT